MQASDLEDESVEFVESDAEKAWKRARFCVVAGKGYDTNAANTGAENPHFQEAMRRSVQVCIDGRIKEDAARDKDEVSDEELSRLCRFTDPLSLSLYSKFIHLVPRLVNVVTVCADILFSTLSFLKCFTRTCLAARRSHPHQRERDKTSPRLAQDCCQMYKFLLRSKTFCSRAASIQSSSVPRARVSHR